MTTKTLNLNQIREDVASLVRPPGWQSFGYFPSNATYPFVVVSTDRIQYIRDMGEGAEIDLRITIYTNINEQEQSQRLVDAFLSWGTDTSAPSALLDPAGMVDITSFKTIKIGVAENFRIVRELDERVAYAADLTVQVRT